MISPIRERIPLPGKNHILRSSLIMVAAGIALFTIEKTRAGELESWRSCCGAVCLRTVTGLLGDDVDLARIREQVKPNTLGIVSLGTIAQSAKEMGYYATGLRLHRDWIERVSVPLIAHDPPNHLVVLLGFGENQGVTIIDPPKSHRKMNNEELNVREYWNVVAVSKVPLLLDGISANNGDTRTANVNKIQSKDFGIVRFGNPIWNVGGARLTDKIRHTFSFVNISKKSVIITKIKPNCSCLEIIRFTETIPPGDQGTIEVSMDPNGMMGYVTKKIVGFVRTIDSEKLHKFNLDVTGELSRRGEIVLKPRKIVCSGLIKGETLLKTVTIQRLGYAPLSLEEVTSNSPYIKARVIQSAIPDPYKSQVELQIDTSNATGSIEGEVVFKTNQPNCQNTAILEISGNVIPHISSEPPELFWGLLKPDEHFEKTVKLYSQINKSFKIVGATTNIENIKVTIIPLSNLQTGWRLTLTHTGVFETGLLKGNLLVKVDDPDVSVVKVPFTAYVTANSN